MRTEVDAAYDKMLDPIAGSQLQRKSVAGIVNLFVDDLFGTSGTEMEQRVPGLTEKTSKLSRKTGMMGPSQDKRIRWTAGSQSGSCIEVRQQKKLLMNWTRSSLTKYEKISTVPMRCIVPKPCGTKKWVAD